MLELRAATAQCERVQADQRRGLGTRMLAHQRVHERIASETRAHAVLRGLTGASGSSGGASITVPAPNTRGSNRPPRSGSIVRKSSVSGLVTVFGARWRTRSAETGPTDAPEATGSRSASWHSRTIAGLDLVSAVVADIGSTVTPRS